MKNICSYLHKINLILSDNEAYPVEPSLKCSLEQLQHIMLISPMILVIRFHENSPVLHKIDYVGYISKVSARNGSRY